MWLFKTLSNSKGDSLFGWGLKGQSLHVLCQNKDFIRHELSQSCRWVMGLQARGRVADGEIRTKNKPPAGPLFVDLSVLTQQTGTRTDLKTSRRCSFFFFLMKKFKCLWLKKSNHFSLPERVLLEERGHSQFGFCLYYGHKKKYPTLLFQLQLSTHEASMPAEFLSELSTWQIGSLQDQGPLCCNVGSADLDFNCHLYPSQKWVITPNESYLPQTGVKRKESS